ncbi:sulfurtransferase complex subunit TusC [Buchnera aphidicola (Aphis craccivora)]|uniref:Sulfurtransferase complex subunit TusC n=1 Tax=Buchnera aphidicola (Aphis craccivora) TaxID=466616 RepID=A0A4D6XJ87_9GAMM|nr:sulfurtransferase complex subunit TusC [Buchnera aphidicola]QCI16752.1 sulfurtransferase complex subunit TusC [Buchnera aphidicola (Aphis craccivora)]QLL40884.1 sulfurtransferase complex subunit TusC [Buchnera aphidicola (Aphis craccivore)]WAI17726.1 MAG: sulfurtransferase complex subunit TusC [Buchnera aphidicola (Aphis craccivora)]
MKKIAFVFSHAPHGTTLGKEGLDAILGVSSILKQISLFFINDGIFQLLKSYKSEKILTRNYTSLFSVLSLYEIKDFYCCKLSLFQRGVNFDTEFILPVNILNSYFLRLKLDDHDAIINF